MRLWAPVLLLVSVLGCSAGEVERTLAIIKPDAYAKSSPQEVMRAIADRGFKIVQTSESTLSPALVAEFYKEHKERAFFGELVDFMSSGVSMAMVLEKADAIRSWRAAMGPTDSNKARQSAPASLRAIYGTDNTRNALHGSDSKESAAREIGFFFPHLQEQNPEADGDAKTPSTLQGRLTMERLDGLTKDEIFQTVLKEAADLAVDVETIVDRLNNEQGESQSMPPTESDHSEL